MFVKLSLAFFLQLSMKSILGLVGDGGEPDIVFFLWKGLLKFREEVCETDKIRNKSWMWNFFYEKLFNSRIDQSEIIRKNGANLNWRNDYMSSFYVF